MVPPNHLLGEMMIPDPIKADVMMDLKEAARLVSKYELLALPIVDKSGRLEGIMTIDNVIDKEAAMGAGIIVTGLTDVFGFFAF